MESTTNPAFTGWRSYTLVELPVMLFFFGQTVTGAVTSDLMLYRSCQSILGVDSKDCDLLHTKNSTDDVKDLNALIQPHVSYILMYKSFVDGLVPAFLAFFLGSWSDSNGRKPLLVASYAGSTTSFLLWSILSSKPLNPWFYLTASVPPALVGGYFSLILASYSYIADIRKENDRAWHLTWLQAVLCVGQLSGNFAGPVIFKKFGYPIVFGAASAGNFLATIYVVFFVPESVNTTNRNVKRWRSPFNWTVIRNMFATCTEKREGFDRIVIWCCISGLGIFMLVGEGELSIGFLFASARLGWGVDEYSLYMATVVVLGIVGTLLGALIFKKFIDETMSDMLIAVLATVSGFAGAIAKSFTRQSWNLYLSTVLAMFGGISGPVIRAALSKSAPAQDTGKVFSLATSMEALIPLGSTPLYTMVYAHSMPPIYPSPVYLVSAGLYALIIVIVVTIDRRLSKLASNPVTAIDQAID